MERQMLNPGSPDRRRAPTAPRRRKLAAVGLSGVVVLGGAVTLANAQSASGVTAPRESAPSSASSPASSPASSGSARAAAPVGLLRSAKPAQLARVRSVDAPRPVRVGMRFKAKVRGAALGVRVYQPVKRKSATPRSAQLWSPTGKRLAAARIKGSAGEGWKTVRFAKPVRLRAGAFYTVSAFSPSGTYARTDSGFRSGVATRYLAAPAKMNGVFNHALGAPARRGAGHPNYWVDVVFRPGATAGGGGGTGGTTTPPTPAGPRPDGCAPVPSACGYPDATNTGPASVNGLTQVPEAATSGAGWKWNPTYKSIFVSGTGAVLDRLDVHGAVVIDAPNVTVSNSRIASCGGSDDSDVVAIRYKSSDASYQGSGARVVNNEIIGTPAGCDRRARSGVRDIYGAAPNVLVKGNDISGTGNGITIEHEGVVEDNWIHDLGHVAGDHHSGISNHGGAAGVVVRHNTVLLHGQKFAGGGGVSGALTVYSDFGHAQNVTLQDNLISGGSYVVYGGASGDQSAQWPTPTNIKILSNRFVCGDWLYGAYMAFERGGAGNELADNYCDQDGRAVR
ncbi:DUF4082 domain-containing protein [Nocardioides sp. LMS-CY]|uniref:DUF4082 domain-containing protein n=1 Tax=Nocardioides soli TaxID=1036020 RepID=A0A7W4VUB5_9ACTN|nr:MULTISPECIES: DUF4082 domain-containing protein [Nocardioides]MBB3041935.1 hypothetical protein [Nocardioides soli]QWF21436.1 DUF4082 domain-containing protein [Nocardioides sp. LMS-CY]